jgi:hypothetical protein
MKSSTRTVFTIWQRHYYAKHKEAPMRERSKPDPSAETPSETEAPEHEQSDPQRARLADRRRSSAPTREAAPLSAAQQKAAGQARGWLSGALARYKETALDSLLVFDETSRVRARAEAVKSLRVDLEAARKLQDGMIDAVREKGAELLGAAVGFGKEAVGRMTGVFGTAAGFVRGFTDAEEKITAVDAATRVVRNVREAVEDYCRKEAQAIAQLSDAQLWATAQALGAVEGDDARAELLIAMGLPEFGPSVMEDMARRHLIAFDELVRSAQPMIERGGEVSDRKEQRVEEKATVRQAEERLGFDGGEIDADRTARAERGRGDK